MHTENSFVTLTYDQENLPWDKSLNKKHFQDFMKRLRARTQTPIRYFHCGEYGSDLKRPHYHAILFGRDFEDKELWTVAGGHRLYTSEELARTWGKGFCTIGDVTWETAAYTAGYTTKKITGNAAHDHYWGITDTGIEIQLEPEYGTMSLKPGIGEQWFREYRDDCYPSDFITQKGRKNRLPRFYDILAERHAEIDLVTIKENRLRKARSRHEDCTPKRLRAREQCAKARLDLHNRNLEG